MGRVGECRNGNDAKTILKDEILKKLKIIKENLTFFIKTVRKVI